MVNACRIKPFYFFACTGHTQKNGAVNTQITTTPHHYFVYALYYITAVQFSFVSLPNGNNTDIIERS